MGTVELASLIDRTRGVRVSEEVESYLVRLVRTTREHAAVTLGGSPRASVALHRASQAGRSSMGVPTPCPRTSDTLRRAVLAHRLMLDVDRQMRGMTAERALDEVIEGVAAPPLTT